MILERLQVLDMIKFIKPVIPSDTGTGKNCLFARVENDNLICTGGNEFSNKKVVLVALNTTEQSAKKGKLPKTFMIQRPELLAFEKMMEEHKAYCKKMAKNDPDHLHVEITENKLISHDGYVTYPQPKHQFKDLESFFQVKKDKVSELKVMSAEITVCLTGFKKSQDIEITFTGDQKPVHFLQGDYEAIMLPPVEKKKEDDGQKKF